jgi:putative hydrolase of the HAD superfamily
MTDTALWFDLDGTLVAVDDYGAILERACETVGIDGEERTEFVAAYDDHFFEYLMDLVDDPYHRATEAAVETAGVDADPAAFVDALLDAECENTRVPAAVHETLSELDESHRLGVLTNGVDCWQRTKLDHHDLAHHFDAVVVSEEAGAHKPNQTAFDLAERRIEADERWMIGDDRDADVGGARAAGWNAVHVAEPASLPNVLDRL